MSWNRLQSCSDFLVGGTSVAATFGSALSSGSKLIAVVSEYTSGATATGVADGNGNNFTLVADTGLVGAGYGGAQIWVLDTPSGDVGTTPTITATFSGFGNYSMVVQEVSGLLPGATGSLDGTAGTSTGETGTTPFSTGSPAYSSSAANEYLVSAMTLAANSGSYPTITPSALTADPNNVSFDNQVTNAGIAYGNSTGGSESGSWTVSTSSAAYNGWGVILVAFKLASAPVSSPERGLLMGCYP